LQEVTANNVANANTDAFTHSYAVTVTHTHSVPEHDTLA
jgi:flagellar basal body rod protein FlgB